MSEFIANNFYYIVYAWFAVGFFTFFYLLKVPAPFGRHTSDAWGPMMDNRIGWIIYEIASPIFFGFFLLTGSLDMNTTLYVLLAIWFTHYFNRSLIYPLRQKDTSKKIPVLIVGSAIFFNFMNGFVCGYYLGNLADHLTNDWLTDPRFIVGGLIWLTGFLINIQSDNLLLGLRKPGEKGYKIPYGGLFKWISCPNHFGEIIEWTGFAIMCWGLPTSTFAFWTAANLIPRAIAHHKWYLNKFTDYPKERKAVIPFIW